VTLVEERAIEEAEASGKRLAKKGEARPLEGLPITIKDSIITAGVRSTWGMKIFEHRVATTDAPTVARLRTAGAIVIAKTNAPEMTIDYDCDNPVFGATNNPWNHARVPGRSSGGEAAALAAGISPLGMGSDYGGSIRVPSHFCRVAGLKPSWGTIPASSHMSPGLPPPPVAHMSTIGPMARYVDDLTMAYNIVKGPHPSALYTAPTPQAHPERVAVKKIRVGFFTAASQVPVCARSATPRFAPRARSRSSA
jgi:amidase